MRGATLDLTNNSLAVSYTGASPVAVIQNLIKSGAASGSMERSWDRVVLRTGGGE